MDYTIVHMASQDLNKYLVRRLAKIQSKSLLVSSPENLTYLTGQKFSPFEREGFVLITPNSATLLISPLRYEQFKNLSHLKVQTFSSKNTLSSLINNSNLRSMSIEASDLRVNELTKLEQKINSTKIIHDQNTIENLRQIKDKWEIEQIKKACKISAKTWQQISPTIKPGLSEKQIASQIINLQKKLGADGAPNGFDPIVASGPGSAVPHHQTSDRKLKNNQVLLVDFGCQVNGYASDMTRTIYLGKSSKKFSQIKKLVDQAYASALSKAKVGTQAHQLDQATIDVFTKSRLEEHIMHTTGHGIGLAVHESPSISAYSQTKTKLQANMVITIEPGLYFPGQFGYRHENTILITPKGAKVLTVT